MKIIGAVGYNGSGKDTVLEIIAKKEHCKIVSFGDKAREAAKKEGLEPTRSNLVDVSKKYREKYGEDYFIKLVISDIRKEKTEMVCVTGVRTMLDAMTFREEFGKDFVLIYVEVPAEIRYERLSKRGEARDPHTYEEFEVQEKNEEEAFHLSETIPLANYTVSNAGDMKALEANVDQLLVEIFKPGA